MQRPWSRPVLKYEITQSSKSISKYHIDYKYTVTIYVKKSCLFVSRYRNTSKFKAGQEFILVK